MPSNHYLIVQWKDVSAWILKRFGTCSQSKWTFPRRPLPRLGEDLKADSLDLVELVMDLEQEYGLQIPEEDLPNIHTVGDIVAALNK